MAVHPANAVFVSGDGKVSFNESGRKLDSLGNVVWGDRQSLRGARARVRPEIEEAYRQMDQQAQQPPAQQKPPTMPTYQPPAGAQQPPMEQPATTPWRSVTQWQVPGGGQPQQAPAWEPPPSGLGQPQNWNQFAPQQPPQQQAPAWEPPPSGLGQPQQFRYDPLQSAPGSWNRFRR